MDLKAEAQDSLIYCNAVNYHFASDAVHAEVQCTLQELVVWGGMVANCAEDALSRVVDCSAETLRSVTYCPDRTKGGVLIRPKYYQGDRCGRAVFPRLTDLAIRLEPALLPVEFGWSTPELQHLRLLCVISASDRSRDERGAGKGDFRLPHCDVLREWLGVEETRSATDAMLMVGRRGAAGHLRDMLLDSCPKLESITIAVCSTACSADRKETDRSQADWIVLLPPKPLPWSIHRLLLLPVVKPVVTSDTAIVKKFPEIQAVYRSPLSNLTDNLIKLIVTFLGRPRWEHQDKHIPPAMAERLGLPDSFCRTRCADLLKQSSPKWDCEMPDW